MLKDLLTKLFELLLGPRPLIKVVGPEVFSTEYDKPRNGQVCLVHAGTYWREATWYTMEEARVPTGWYNQHDHRLSLKYVLWCEAPKAITTVDPTRAVRYNDYIDSENQPGECS